MTKKKARASMGRHPRVTREFANYWIDQCRDERFDRRRSEALGDMNQAERVDFLLSVAFAIGPRSGQISLLGA